MTAILSVIGWWTFLALTIGPCLSWLFFYGERNAANHSDSSFE